MKFFDGKEDVMDVQITPYGRYLLSKGKFKPFYYIFSDEGVLYDSKYGAQDRPNGSTGYEQTQNDIQTRIKEETPYLKAQANHGSIEEFIKTIQYPLAEAHHAAGFTLQSIPNYNEHTNKIHANSLGTMNLSRDEAPAWEVNVLQGVITGSASALTGSSTSAVYNIPQLNFQEQEFKSSINRGESQFSNFDETCAAEQLGFGMGGDIFADGAHVEVEGKSLILEIDENNGIYGMENFDIEVFKIETIESPRTADHGKEVLIPLSFARTKSNIINDILLREDEMPLTVDLSLEQMEPDFVEYFLDISFDGEIDTDILCKLARDPAKDLFSNRFLDCKDTRTVKPKSEFDLYQTDVTEDDIKEC